MTDLRLCIEAAASQDQAAQLIEAGRHNEALHAIASAVDGIYKRSEVFGHALYLYGFDRMLTRLGQLLEEPALRAQAAPPSGGGCLLLLSEFYVFGGHSRVTEDLVQALGGASVVLTDLFGAYAAGRARLADARTRMPQALVHALSETSLLGKVRELQQVFKALRPATVMVLAHHPDPVPYVAAASLHPSVRKVFVHHCDHQPALGATLDGYAHLDFTEHLQTICRGNLGRPTWRLPLFVPDFGVKVFSQPTKQSLNIVTCGSAVKYSRDGPVAYHQVVARVLGAFGGRYWHIGALDAAWLERIAQALSAQGTAPERFVYLPHVPSLWQTLKEIDGHVFLGSFPTPGGRASIEAQGCGYPVVYYAADERAPLLRHADIFAEDDLGWQTEEQLLQRLDIALQDHPRRVRQARRYYERGYSRPAFDDALHAVLQPTASASEAASAP